jgi:hypothetical protein
LAVLSSLTDQHQFDAAQPSTAFEGPTGWVESSPLYSFCSFGVHFVAYEYGVLLIDAANFSSQNLGHY